MHAFTPQVFNISGTEEETMTGDELLARLRTRQAADLRACFPGLSERELMQILTAAPQHAVNILQRCFDCDREDAKAAWNEYVLRYVDGHNAADHSRSGTTGPLQAPAHLS
jgi:hypothetical protein